MLHCRKDRSYVKVTALRPMKVVDQVKLALWIALIGPNKITL